jgi:hypothetical protein
MSLIAAPAAAPATPEQEAKPEAAPSEGAAASPEGASPPVTETTDWYYDDGIKGTGERPEWLKEKYKSAADQAKAYVEVEKKLGAFKGAPDKYDLSLPDYPDVKMREDDPILGDFLESAKKNGISQEYVTELLGTYAHALTVNIPDPEAEIKKLGPNAHQELKILSTWAESKLTPQEFEIFQRMTMTAESVRLWEKIRMIATQGDVAAPATAHVQRETEAQVRALVSDPRYDTDPAFRDDVRRRMSAAIGVK